MTREEATKIIKDYEVNGCGYCHQGGDEVEEAFKMAIKALEQEPCEDCITLRLGKGTLKYSDKDYIVYKKEWLKKWWQPELVLLGIDLPSIQPKPKTDVLDKIRAEIHATAEMHEDGYYYLRDEWIDEIIDKHTEENTSNCDSCKHQNEVDGSNCYERVKGIRDNYTAEKE